MTTVLELSNDLVVIGETAARAFVRGTKKLKEHIEPMALGLAEAKRRYPVLQEFGKWIKDSAFAGLGKTDRAALIKMGENWSDELLAFIMESPLISPRLIWESFSHDGKTEDEDGDEDDNGSEFYGSDRISRTNEAWDTIDPRLVNSLVDAVPKLKECMIWEPAAGCGMMLDQLEAAGARVYIGTDIEPRRDDIHTLDVITAEEMVTGTNAVVTNPPWGRLAAPFVRHVLMLAEKNSAIVAMLLPLPWITGRRVADMTGNTGFDRMIVPRYRARWMTPKKKLSLKTDHLDLR